MEINNEFKEKSKEAVKRGVLHGYCPNHLSVEHRKELWVFPLNILFSSFRNESDGSHTMGSALYVPDLSSFTQEKETWTMTYWNQYGGNDYVILTFKLPGLVYRGDKFVNGLPVGSAEGMIKNNVEEGWKLFFFHLTLLGLAKGEKCESAQV